MSPPQWKVLFAMCVLWDISPCKCLHILIHASNFVLALGGLLMHMPTHSYLGI